MLYFLNTISLFDYFFFFTISLHPKSSLFPYTTLFRSPSFDHTKGYDHKQQKADMILEKTPPPQPRIKGAVPQIRSEEHTSEPQSRRDLVCRLLLEKKKN